MTTVPAAVRRRFASAATIVLLATAAAGCNDSDDPGADPEPSGATESSSEATDSPSASPSESPSSTVLPSTGLVLESGGLSLNAPEGWKKDTSYATWQAVAALPDSMSTNLIVQSITTLSPNDTVDDLAQQDMDTITRRSPKAKVEQLGTVEIDGVEFFHNAIKEYPSVLSDSYGALVGDRVVEIYFNLDKYAYPTQPDRDAVIASVLASAQIDDTAL